VRKRTNFAQAPGSPVLTVRQRKGKCVVLFTSSITA